MDSSVYTDIFLSNHRAKPILDHAMEEETVYLERYVAPIAGYMQWETANATYILSLNKALELGFVKRFKHVRSLNKVLELVL